MSPAVPLPGEGGSEEIVRRARAGERAAFEEIYLRYHDALLLSARCRLSPALRARLSSEDVLQSVVADALSDIGRFEPRGPGSLARWLHAAVLNKIRNKADWFGAEKRAGDVPLSEAHGDLGQAAPAYLEAERWEPLERALAGLPEDMREAVVLRTVEGLSNSEAATALGKSAEATSKLYNRALARLGTRLSGGPGV